MIDDRFYKLLPTNDTYEPLSIQQSLERAKGTLYEAWFDTMKASPWYKAMWDGHPVFDDANPREDGINRAQKAKELFGDIRKVKFDAWWLTTGHRIFAEGVPYMPVQTLSVKFKNKRVTKRREDGVRPVQSMLIEVPLNLKPSAIRKQLLEIVKEFEALGSNFNRWEYSTADAPFSRDAKFTFLTISNWLQVFEQWEQNKSRKNPQYQLHDLCQDMGLAPELGFDDVEDFTATHMSETKRNEKMATTAEKALQNARSLMANALFLDFPNTNPHPLATNFSSTELKREIKRANKPAQHDFNLTRQRKKTEAKRLAEKK